MKQRPDDRRTAANDVSATSKDQTRDFSLTLWQKVMYAILLTVLSMAVVLGGSLLVAGPWGGVVFVLMATLLGVATFFVTSGWMYKLRLAQREIVIVSRQQQFVIPLDRVGMLVKASGFPYPILWLVLRNCDQGREVPTKRVDARTRELIEAYQRRNPGKKITIMPIPGLFIRSMRGFTEALKERIPPLVVDERLGSK